MDTFIQELGYLNISPMYLKDILTKINGIIAGSFPIACITNSIHHYNDIDIFHNYNNIKDIIFGDDIYVFEDKLWIRKIRKRDNKPIKISFTYTNMDPKVFIQNGLLSLNTSYIEFHKDWRWNISVNIKDKICYINNICFYRKCNQIEYMIKCYNMIVEIGSYNLHNNKLYGLYKDKCKINIKGKNINKIEFLSHNIGYIIFDDDSIQDINLDNIIPIVYDYYNNICIPIYKELMIYININMDTPYEYHNFVYRTLKYINRGWTISNLNNYMIL